METLTFSTETGSIYEVDPANRRVRRITGHRPPTERQGSDGEWKTFVWIRPILWSDGKLALFFDWTGLGNGTWTSPLAHPPADEVVEALGVEVWDA